MTKIDRTEIKPVLNLICLRLYGIFQNNIAKIRVQVIQNMLAILKNDSTVTTN